MTEAGVLDSTDETFREYERVVDPKYLEQIRGYADINYLDNTGAFDVNVSIKVPPPAPGNNVGLYVA